MDLATRDALVIARLAAVAPLTGRQAVLEVIRTSGRDFLRVDGLDGNNLETDVAGLQTAVSDLADATARAQASVLLTSTSGPTNSGARLVPVPRPSSVASTDHYRMRVVASGN